MMLSGLSQCPQRLPRRGSAAAACRPGPLAPAHGLSSGLRLSSPVAPPPQPAAWHGGPAPRAAPPPPSWLCAGVALAERGIVDTSVGRYRCHSKAGAVVDAVSETRDGKVHVRITVSYHNAPHNAPNDLQLHWGMYRASAARWHHPREAVPPESTPESGGGAMRTAMSRVHEGGPAWTARFEVPTKLAPLHLAFSLYSPAANTFDTPIRAGHFCVPVGMSAGSPAPLGASVVASRPGDNGSTNPRDATCAVNFATFSRHASSVQLCLVRVALPGGGGGGGHASHGGQNGGGGGYGSGGGPLEAENVLEIVLDPLTHRTGDVWHICVHGLKDLESLCWAWRADGEVLWQHGNRFHPGFMLMDPYATRAVPVRLPPNAHKAAPRMAPEQRPDEPVLLGSLAAFVHAPYDWQGLHAAVRGGQSRVRALEESVIVEVDVVGFTTGPDAEAVVPAAHRGKYLGVLDRVDALKSWGATTVLLGAVCLSGPTPGSPDPSARSPLALFAPDPAMAVGGPLAAAVELKALIAGLHGAGMEVLVQVEFCVTAEGGDASAGRLQGLRGLDHAVYYRDGLEAPVLNCGHPLVRSLVVDCLRHWAAEYRVEGFCFRNAENLTQDKFGGVLDNPPLAEDIAGDPVLRNLKLLAAVGNPALLPRSGERGFPHWGVWMQLNDRFTSDMCAYAAGARGLLSAVATRLAGSPDLFAPRWDAGLPGGLAAGRRPAFGINAVAPLGDRALHAHVAAVTGSDAVRSEAIARSLLLAQFVAAGQPLVAAATLGGRPELATLVAALAAVRRGYGPLLCPPSIGGTERELAWLSPYGGGEPDWGGSNPDATANVLVMAVGGGEARPNHMLVAAFNPNGEPATFALPRAPGGGMWRLLVDTSRPTPAAAKPAAGGGAASLGAVLSASEQGSYRLGPNGAVLLDAVPPPPPAGTAGPGAGPGAGAGAGGPGPAAPRTYSVRRPASS